MVGYAKAAEIAFTGRTLLAEGGARARAGQPGGARHRAAPRRHAELAAEIAANAPLAVRAIKRMMRMAETETFEQNVHHVFLQLLPLFRSEGLPGGRGRLPREAARPVQRALMRL